MKKLKINILLTLVFFYYSNNCFTQVKQAQVIYKVKTYQKKNNINNSKALRMKKLIDEEIKNIKMQLLINGDKSVFKEIETMHMDDKKKSLHKIAKAITDLRSKYYCNLKEQTIVREHEFDGIIYNIKSNFENVDWKLINETKTLNGYKCYKAITTKTFKSRKGNTINLEVIAWYTPKIPFPLGPKNYVGLPGLVLQLNEGENKTYYASGVNLNPKRKINIGNPKKGEIITEKEYAKKTEGSFNKLINSRLN